MTEEETKETLSDKTEKVEESNTAEVKLEEQLARDVAEKKEKINEVTNLLLQYQGKKNHTPTEKLANQSAWAHLTEQKLPPKKEEFNRFPDYFYAGFWMRVWAYLFDVLCIFFISGIVLQLIGLVLHLSAPFIAVIEIIIYLSYFILLTKLNHGQTLGKVAFGLRVVCFNEAELSWSTVLVREGAARFVLQLGVFYLSYILTAFTGKKQHLGDLFADTSVVTLNQLKAYQGLEQ